MEMRKKQAKGTISVIVTTYDHQGKFLPQSLQSVFSQTRKPVELIVVDDGSADNTRQIIKKIDRKIKYIRHKKKLGGAAAFNTGLVTATGDYVIILPADDWFDSKILAEEAVILDSNPAIGVVYSQAIQVTNGKQELRVAQPAGKKTVIGRFEFSRLLTQGDFVPLLTALFRRKIFGELGSVDANLSYFGDWEYWVRIAKHYPFAYIAKPLAYSRIHAASHSKTEGFRKAFKKEFGYILAKHLPDGEPTSPKIRAQAYNFYFSGLFGQSAVEGNLVKAFKFWWSSFLIKPLSTSHLNAWRPFVVYFKRKFFLRAR